MFEELEGEPPHRLGNGRVAPNGFADRCLQQRLVKQVVQQAFRLALVADLLREWPTVDDVYVPSIGHDSPIIEER